MLHDPKPTSRRRSRTGPDRRRRGLRGRGWSRRAGAPVFLLLLACGPTATGGGEPTPASAAAGEPMILSSYEVPVTLEGERAEVTIDAPPHLPELVDRMKNQEPGERRAGERLGLVLEGVGVPRSGTYFDVYAGLPADAAAGSEDPAGPYHLGTLSSFGPSGAKVQVSYALAPLVERLARERRWSGELTLTFVRRRLVPAPGTEPSEHSGPAVRIDQIRIHRE